MPEPHHKIMSKIRTLYAVVSHQRSGSSMLNTGLGNHSKIQAHGELFHPNPDERFCETKLALPYQEPAHGDAFLEGLFMLAEGSCWPRCSGFKLFYQQAQTGAARSAWTWLERNTDVHIIHLVRANLLDSWVSWEVAQRTDQWFLHRTDCVSEPPEPFDVDVDKCEKFFDWVEQQREWDSPPICETSVDRA